MVAETAAASQDRGPTLRRFRLSHTHLAPVGCSPTQLLHSCSTGAQPLWSALRTCATLYLQRVLAASPAQVVVLVGQVAKDDFAEFLHLEVPDHPLGPIQVAGRDRLLVSIRHPNSRREVKSFQGQLTDAQLAQVRGALAIPS